MNACDGGRMGTARTRSDALSASTALSTYCIQASVSKIANRSETGRRNLDEPGIRMPHSEALSELFAIQGSPKQMSHEREALADRTKTR
jgi:hypothetical protein